MAAGVNRHRLLKAVFQGETKRVIVMSESIEPGVGECPRIRAVRLLAGCPGSQDYIAPMAKRDSIAVVKLKRLSVYFHFTAWNESFACVQADSGSIL
jgi:hypothetical protein